MIPPRDLTSHLKSANITSRVKNAAISDSFLGEKKEDFGSVRANFVEYDS